jgi:hypothetical protein
VLGGTAGHAVDAQADRGRTARVAWSFSRHMTIAAVVAVIGVTFHVTASGSRPPASLSVLVLAILIAQVTMPHRHLRTLLSDPSHTTRLAADELLTTTWQRRRDDPQRVRFCGYTVSPRASIATNWSMRRTRVAGCLASLMRKRIA